MERPVGLPFIGRGFRDGFGGLWQAKATGGSLVTLRSPNHDMDVHDKDYFEARAEQEVRMAQEAEHSQAVQAHYQMADMYLERIHGEKPDKPPPLIWSELPVANRENTAHFGTDPTRE